MEEPKVVIEEVADPVEIARHREQHEQFERNSDWLEEHWPELLPQARGKFVAVACEEAYLADTAENARSLAKAAHSNEKGILVRFVLAQKGPRVLLLAGNHRYQVVQV